MKKLSILVVYLFFSLMSWAAVVPNILATELRCVPHAYENKYIFSFNTNHKPTKAYIRFYMSYDDMKNSLNVVNADDYNGTNSNKPAFYYEFPSSALKQGTMTVTLGGVGGETDANGKITNACLPAGVIYWSVYVEAEKGTDWGMIYKQGTTGEDAHYRLHATVNTYPETDGFGQIYAAQYNGSTGKKSMMVYAANPNGTATSNRYKLVKEYVNPASGTKFENQRRPAVAPDGKVYIADHGATAFDAYAIRPMMFDNGGIYVWDPNTQTEDNIIVLKQFLNDPRETSSGVAIWNHNGTVKMYGTNTYGEFGFHSVEGGNLWKGYAYDQANQADPNIYGWNGFKEYTLGSPNNSASTETTESTIQRSLGMGDGHGNISIVAMDKGVWLCQHREDDVQYKLDNHSPLPDNPENYILSFIPYNSNSRTWTSTTSNGVVVETGATISGRSELTQYPGSPLQSSPGAGCAYRKINGVDYIFIVQHNANIAQLKVTWSGTTPSVTHVKTFSAVGTKSYIRGTNRETGAITTMCFDYAGNLITTAGGSYFGHSQDIIVYSFPYNRTNAREIQAPNSCRMIPERIAHEDMDQTDWNSVIQPYIEKSKKCALDIYRPMQKGTFNTICLPFNISTLTGTPYAGAEVMKFIGTELKKEGGEYVLNFLFDDVTFNGEDIIKAGVPYLINPKKDVVGIASFESPIQFATTTAAIVDDQDEQYAKFYGVFVQTWIDNPDPDRLKLMLVSDNRLAEIEPDYFYGMRAYFQLQKAIPNNTLSLLNFRRNATTGTEIVVDGKKVNVEKFIREGRAYIRVGGTLYNMDGVKVE